ncbi:hypothetical protein BLNAU_13009 [Blattamonas nauphoetae]|uniref:Uncharacterized protein n=1 Tax=Blattamonas nauphoetae TaxID=2049346 RepID=A0ABQ9XHV8_9EUKA|nr:hypothetical protein BLNAU_13009 [Blattamonas nauphoetae]
MPSTAASPSLLHSNSSKKNLDCETFKLPGIIGESNIHLRSSTNVHHAYLPDISRIPKDRPVPFEKSYDILFQHAVVAKTISFVELQDQDNRKIPKDGATVVTYSTRTRRARASCNSPSSDSISDPFSSSDSSHDSGPATKTEFKCFTYSLNPLGANNSGFDSILLFFKVHNEESNLVVDNPNFVIDALSVIFIQSTLASKHKISASGSNLMFMWIALFSSIYKIHLRDIFPSLFFVKNPYVETFYLEGDNNTEFFMDKRNIWVVDGSARTVEVKYTDRLLLDTIISVLPNTNPNYVRCCFCGLVLEEDFRTTSANASNLVGQSNRQKNSSLHRGRPIRLEWEQSGYLTVTTHKKIGNGCLEPECIQILCFTWGEKVNWTKHLAAGQSNTSVSLVLD